MYLDPLCAIAATTKTDLATRVHNLPAEIFNMIHDYTFTLDHRVNQPLDIDATHKVPHLMQVDPLTRNLLAQQLYARPEPVYCANHEVAAQWLLSLPKNHRAMLREVRVGSGLPEAAQMLDSYNYLAKMQWGYIMHALRSSGAEIGEGVLHFKVSAPVDEKKEGAARERVWSNEIS